jgi:hypothetical protein
MSQCPLATRPIKPGNCDWRNRALAGCAVAIQSHASSGLSSFRVSRHLTTVSATQTQMLTTQHLGQLIDVRVAAAAFGRHAGLNQLSGARSSAAASPAGQARRQAHMRAEWLSRVLARIVALANVDHHWIVSGRPCLRCAGNRALCLCPQTGASYREVVHIDRAHQEPRTQPIA